MLNVKDALQALKVYFQRLFNGRHLPHYLYYNDRAKERQWWWWWWTFIQPRLRLLLLHHLWFPTNIAWSVWRCCSALSSEPNIIQNVYKLSLHWNLYSICIMARMKTQHKKKTSEPSEIISIMILIITIIFCIRMKWNVHWMMMNSGEFVVDREATRL